MTAATADSTQLGGRIAAVFDLDNTLLPHATTERLLIRYLLRTRQYGNRALVYTVVTILRHARLGPAGALRVHRPYLRDRAIAEVDTLAQQVFTTEIQPRLAPIGIARVRWHQQQGHLVALLSGAPQFLAQLVAQYLGIDEVLSTPLAVIDGRYTGALAGLHPYGERKVLLAQIFAQERGVDLPASYAYADHHTDADLLRLFGHPTCINATPRLRVLAASNGWATEDWPAPLAHQPR